MEPIPQLLLISFILIVVAVIIYLATKFTIIQYTLSIKTAKLAIAIIALILFTVIALHIIQPRKISHHAKKAYIYFFPLVEMNRLKNEAIAKHAPANKFKHFRKLLTDKDRDVVSPNNDTLYSIAWLDLAKEPVMLHVPDTKGRYYVMQFNDAYTNNFRCIGSGTTGTKEQYFALIGPQWKEDMPDKIKQILCPTNMVWLLGRTLVDGPNDIPNVIQLQDQYTLTPLSTFVYGEIGDNSYGDWKPSELIKIDFETTPFAFWEQVGSLIQDNPIPKDQKKDFLMFKKLGITKDGFNKTLLSKKAKKAMKKAVIKGPKKLTKKLKKWQKGFTNINNWLVNTKTIGVYGKNYKDRAIVALGYIGALVPQEAIYPICKKDKTGNKLTGKHTYTIHFDANNYPPAQAFWSITLYNAKDFFLIKNPIERYSIGNRTKGIEKNSDDSLDIYIQHETPTDPKHVANWLPAPKGNFYLVLRMYLPSEQAIKGKYKIPPVEKVN